MKKLLEEKDEITLKRHELEKLALDIRYFTEVGKRTSEEQTYFLYDIQIVIKVNEDNNDGVVIISKRLNYGK